MALLNWTATNHDQDDTASSLALALLHHLSLVAFEVRKFSEGAAGQGSTGTWTHELALAASRHSTKLFNDTKKSQRDLLVEFSNGADRHRSWYLANNRVPWLFRALSTLGVIVDDTSVLLHNGQILCTSLSVGFHAGLEPGSEPMETVDRGRELSAYLADLCGAVDQTGWAGDALSPLRSGALVAKDTRYDVFYRALFPSVEVPEAIALGILQSDIVALQLIREIVPMSNSLAASTFKFRFAALWQLVATLRAITAARSELNLTEQIRRDVDGLLTAEQFAPMHTKGARGLRNVLVHYGLGAIDAEDLAWHDPLLGLPQLLLDGLDWCAADRLVERLATDMLRMFAGWTGSFSHTLKTPPQ